MTATNTPAGDNSVATERTVGNTPAEKRTNTPGDAPAIAKRRMREMRTISQMIALYCEKNHPKESRTHVAHCGELVCEECAALDAYAILRTQRCRQMGVKTSCEKCGNHCYKPDMRQRICETMRFSGPRMLTKHPIAAIRHLLGK